MPVQYSWHDHNPRRRRIALTATVLITAALLVCLLILGFVTPLPLPGEEGILVAFGNERAGRNSSTPAVTTTSPVRPRPQPATPEPVKQPEQILTQDFEDAPEIASSQPTPKPKRVKETTKEPQKTLDPTPEPVQQAPEPVKEPPKPVINQNALFTGQKPKNSEGAGSGGDKGNQGTYEGTSPAGSVGVGNGAGSEGVGQGSGGNGPSFSLGGRSARSLPLPSKDYRVGGRVVVRIEVNRNGEVVMAIPGVKGSSTQDTKLLSLAKEAALKASFNVSSKAPERQVGTITYVFKMGE